MSAKPTLKGGSINNKAHCAVPSIPVNHQKKDWIRNLILWMLKGKHVQPILPVRNMKAGVLLKPTMMMVDSVAVIWNARH